MDALILFFKNKTKFTTRDFTLSNWNHINSIGESWVTAAKKEDIDLSIQKWEDYLPSIDIWLDVNRNEIHYVKHLIPTLEWAGGALGVRLRYEPTNLDELYKEFTSTFNNSKSLRQRSNSKDKTAEKELNLWPKDMWDFIDKSPTKFFSIKTYLLDPTKNESTQKLTIDNLPIESNAFDGLIKINIINAQRGFSDVNSEGEESNKKDLSSQLRSYYEKHLNPSDNPTENDLDALHAIQEAKELFDKNLKTSFEPSLSELESLNYPGFGNPQISLSCKLESVETLNHNSAVLYNLSGQNGGLSLPEKCNGLGCQNLKNISS